MMEALARQTRGNCRVTRKLYKAILRKYLTRWSAYVSMIVAMSGLAIDALNDREEHSNTTTHERDTTRLEVR